MDLKRSTVTIDADGIEDEEEEEFSKVFLGQVPIMLRSTYCILSESNDRELTDLGECPYDQGGYFVINGSEKVRPSALFVCACPTLRQTSKNC